MPEKSSFIPSVWQDPFLKIHPQFLKDQEVTQTLQSISNPVDYLKCVESRLDCLHALKCPLSVLERVILFTLKLNKFANTRISYIDGRFLSDSKFKVISSVSGRVTDYRITDLGELMKLNRLAPYYGESKPGVTDPIDNASQRVSRFSLFCPMTISATTILNMSAVTPLYNIMLKEELTEENLVTYPKFA